jgi:hypothetical protein
MAHGSNRFSETFLHRMVDFQITIGEGMVAEYMAW